MSADETTLETVSLATSLATTYPDESVHELAISLLDAGSNLGLPDDTIRRAAIIYRKARIENATTGLAPEHSLAGALYIAANETDNHRPLAAISGEFDLDRSLISRQRYRLVDAVETGYLPPEPADYADYITSELDLDPYTRDRLEKVLDEISYEGGVSPLAVIAGATYYASQQTGGKTLTQRDIQETIGVSNPTIRKHAHSIEDELD